MLIFTLTDKNMLPQLDTPANDGVFYPPTSLARAQKQSHCAYALFPSFFFVISIKERKKNFDKKKGRGRKIFIISCSEFEGNERT